jgi:hypothetical protein
VSICYGQGRKAPGPIGISAPPLILLFPSLLSAAVALHGNFGQARQIGFAYSTAFTICFSDLLFQFRCYTQLLPPRATGVHNGNVLASPGCRTTRHAVGRTAESRVLPVCCVARQLSDEFDLHVW